MVTMCKETGSCYVEQEDRGGLYVKRYKSRPPVKKCVCGKEFSEETQTHLYVTGSNVYDHICDRKECLERLIRRHGRHYREFFVSYSKS